MTWWHTLRLRIAAAVALVAVATLATVGAVVDHEAAINGRERLRSQSLDRLDAAALFYRADGQLRLGAELAGAGLPPVVAAAARADGLATYFDGTRMYAAEQISVGKVLWLALPGTSLDRQRAQLRRSLVTGGLLAVVLAAALGWLVATGLSRRLRRGAQAARELTHGDRSARVAQPGRDEVAVLTGAVDELATTLAERLDRERAFSADVAHELRTPVTALVSSAELLPDDESSALVRGQVGRLRRLVEDLLEISRLEAGTDPARVEEYDSAAATREALELVDPGLAVTSTSSVEVLVDPRRLERVLANLVDNARRHGGPTLEVRVEGARIVVHDDGEGFPADVVRDGPRRFASHGRNAGSGLGLTIAARQAEVMGATLRLANANGAQAVIDLRPAASGFAQAPASGESVRPTAPGSSPP